MLGIKKLITTASHPQCDGAVERFNRTLKTMIRKYVVKFGVQWDQYLHGILWAYRNTPHSSTREKPSYLLFGFDCRFPSEAALLPSTPLNVTDVSDYREELVLTLSNARNIAMKTNLESQRRYKEQYDKTAATPKFWIGDWVLVHFAQEETGKMRKLSQPWHGPYRIVSRDDPDVTVTKLYFPDDPQIQVHQSRVQPCPPSFPGGFYWYGKRKSGPGRPPKWVKERLKQIEDTLDEAPMPEKQAFPANISEENSSSKKPQEKRTDVTVSNEKSPRRNKKHTRRARKVKKDQAAPKKQYNLRSRDQKNKSLGRACLTGEMCNRESHLRESPDIN